MRHGAVSGPRGPQIIESHTCTCCDEANYLRQKLITGEGPVGEGVRGASKRPVVNWCRAK